MKDTKFDIVDYIRKLRSVGVSQEIAEVQAQELEHVLEVAIHTSKEEMKVKDLVTKQDLENTKLELEKKMVQVKAEIHKAKYDVIVWIGGMLIASGLIQHFFK